MPVPEAGNYRFAETLETSRSGRLQWGESQLVFGYRFCDLSRRSFSAVPTSKADPEEVGGRMESFRETT
jgi:hypothetical protein